MSSPTSRPSPSDGIIALGSRSTTPPPPCPPEPVPPGTRSTARMTTRLSSGVANVLFADSYANMPNCSPPASTFTSRHRQRTRSRREVLAGMLNRDPLGSRAIGVRCQRRRSLEAANYSPLVKHSKQKAPILTGAFCCFDGSDPAILQRGLRGRRAGKTSARWVQARQSRAAFCTSAGTARDFTRLFIVLAAAHFLLDSSVFDQLSKPLHRILNFFVVSQTQLNHERPPSWQPPKTENRKDHGPVPLSHRTSKRQRLSNRRGGSSTRINANSEAAKVYSGLV